MTFGLVAGAAASTTTKLYEGALAAPGTTLDSGAFGTGYKVIRFYVAMPSAFAAVPVDVYTYFNHTAGGKYSYVQLRVQHASVAGARATGANNIPNLQLDSGTAGTLAIEGVVFNMASDVMKQFSINYIGDEISDANQRTCWVSGSFNELTAEVTRIEVVSSANFPAGTQLLVFGDK